MNNHTMPLCATVELTFRHYKTFEPQTTVKIFRAKDQADLELILAEYCNRAGIIDLKILSQKDITHET